MYLPVSLTIPIAYIELYIIEESFFKKFYTNPYNSINLEVKTLRQNFELHTYTYPPATSNFQ